VWGVFMEITPELKVKEQWNKLTGKGKTTEKSEQ
jgi:hypothetical protein